MPGARETARRIRQLVRCIIDRANVACCGMSAQRTDRNGRP
jgi:hypothetical protein